MTDQLEVATSQDIERNNDVDFSESSLAPNKKTHVYIKDGVKGWVPVKLIDVVGGKATVTCESHLPFALDERFRHAGKILLHNAGDPSDEETSLTSFTTASSLKSHPIEFAIDENSDDRITVRLKDYGGSLPLQYVDDDGNHQVVADLRDLPFIHEANVLYNIKARYEAPNEAIYTRLHHRIIIAINPNKWINGLYAEDTRLQYAEKLVWKVQPKALSLLDPHIYEISSQAFKGMTRNEDNQTIVVSGESGAGKTVSSKILMAHLATFHDLEKAYYMRQSITKKTVHASKEITKGFFWIFLSKIFGRWKNVEEKIARPENEVEEEFDIEAPETIIDEEPEEMKQENVIVQRVLDSNPLLEAFGNAKTERNDNSSRFSKHNKLQFHVEYFGTAHSTCNIAGSLCETYLLEKSRVVKHNNDKEERSFHIFYQLLAAPQEDKEKIWEGLSQSTFRYIGSNHDVDKFTNQESWKNTMAALHLIGITGEALRTLLRALCIVLQLGNITFECNPLDEEGSVILDKDELGLLSQLSGLDCDELEHCFTHKTVTAVYDSYQVPLNAESASSACNAFAKEIYSITFDWLVKCINDATSADKNYLKAKEVNKFREIGILDIFGFECFDVNSFEQLLINHTNERLQKNFTENILDDVAKEYKAQGIFLEEVENEDNAAVLKFFEAKPLGMIELLNEECIRPKGSDAGFVNKLFATKGSSSRSILIFKKHYHLSKTKTMFGIRHYAGDCDYDAKDFIAKNIDTLSGDVLSCGRKTTNEIIRTGLIALGDGNISKRKGFLVGVTLWTKFGNQMTPLLNTLKKTNVWYVRCINANIHKMSDSFDMKYALQQLRFAGVLSALKMSRSSYPNKLTFDYTLERFWFLAEYDFLHETIDGNGSQQRSDCENLLTYLLKPFEFHSNGNISKSFTVGKSMVYFRNGALEFLESERWKAFDRCVTIIQTAIRGSLARKHYKIILKDPSRYEKKKLQLYGIRTLARTIFLLPKYLFRYIFGIVKRPPFQHRPSWH